MVETVFATARTSDPVFLIFSVRDFAISDGLSGCKSQKGFANRSSNEIALELGELSCNHIDSSLALVSDLLVCSTNLFLLVLRHALLHFLSLGEVCS